MSFLWYNIDGVSMMVYLSYLIVINIFSFLCYGIDKWKAVTKRNRISERNLFFLSIIGGSLGALFGMFFFRHKIRKFRFYVWNIFSFSIWIVGTMQLWRFF